jgi:hypothetical protein
VIAVAIEAETAAGSAVGIAIGAVAVVAVVATAAVVAVLAVLAVVAIVVSAVKGVAVAVIATTDHREPKSRPRTASLQCPPSPWSLREPPRAR